MGEKWRLFLGAHGGHCHLALALLLGGGACWVPVFRLWPPAGLLCRSYLRDLVSLCSLPPTQGSRSLQEACLYHASQVLLISAPPVLLPRASAAPVLPAFLLAVFLREVGSRCEREPSSVASGPVTCVVTQVVYPLQASSLNCKMRMTYTVGRVVPRMRVRSGNLPGPGPWKLLRKRGPVA